MSLPTLFAGKSAPGLSAALDLRFALDKSLTAYRGPTPSFSRASTGTFFNSSGVLTSAAINAPRFDHTYNGTSWVSRGLLVEEQRTNSFRYSEDFSNAIWYKINMSITANNAVAPDGTTTADKAIPTGSFPTFYFNSPFNPGSTATLSIFAKAAGYNTVRLQYDLGQSAIFDLSTATVTGINGSSTGKIENVGNGWYRLILTSTSVSSNNAPIFVIDGVSGDGSSGVLFWGAQSEAGAFATSYIPSTGNSSTTRSADVCQITGTDFSGFWNGTEGTVACEFDSFATIGTATYGALYFSDTTASNYYRLIIGGSSVFSTYRTGGASDALLTLGSASNSTLKAAYCFKVNDVAGSLNGAAVATDNSVAAPIATQLEFSRTDLTSEKLNGHIARLRYFNKRLPNATLQQLST